eukprot:CAMPEP_0176465748 /NCGR_PEP_ID=MMETSP0127-20121128/37478_1 /TAXON_ID=938130 /ORGANISM="Platyophrya macrostoma, Strain WH" /LENGTH=142 /DNA_ID=CAMNT_0017858777 /DNA_START=222 /DNA_END=647 /DNA_ORIENTATION=-
MHLDVPDHLVLEGFRVNMRNGSTDSVGLVSNGGGEVAKDGIAGSPLLFVTVRHFNAISVELHCGCWGTNNQCVPDYVPLREVRGEELKFAVGLFQFLVTLCCFSFCVGFLPSLDEEFKFAVALFQFLVTLCCFSFCVGFLPS